MMRCGQRVADVAAGKLSLKEAVAQVTAMTGQPRRKVYARALELTRRMRQAA